MMATLGRATGVSLKQARGPCVSSGIRARYCAGEIDSADTNRRVPYATPLAESGVSAGRVENGAPWMGAGFHAEKCQTGRHVVIGRNPVSVDVTLTPDA